MYDVDAREVHNGLGSNEFYEIYFEARDDPFLDALDLESLYFNSEAREYLDDLEAREHEPATVCYCLTV